MQITVLALNQRTTQKSLALTLQGKQTTYFHHESTKIAPSLGNDSQENCNSLQDSQALAGMWFLPSLVVTLHTQKGNAKGAEQLLTKTKELGRLLKLQMFHGDAHCILCCFRGLSC